MFAQEGERLVGTHYSAHTHLLPSIALVLLSLCVYVRVHVKFPYNSRTCLAFRGCTMIGSATEMKYQVSRMLELFVPTEKLEAIAGVLLNRTVVSLSLHAHVHVSQQESIRVYSALLASFATFIMFTCSHLTIKHK